MKKLLLLLVLTLQTVAWSQSRDPRADRFNYEPSEIIVKLKDEVSAGVTYNKSGKGKTTKDIAAQMGIAEKVKSFEVLFSETSVVASIKRKAAQQRKKSALTQKQQEKNGYEEEDIISLKNIFLLELEHEQENIGELLETLSEHPDVEFAEPNYRYSANDFTINSGMLTEAELRKHKSKAVASVAAANDPLYSQQPGIGATNLDQVWEAGTTGNGQQVIAILDTGVDYTHPDLEANSWVNEAELNGVEGHDDDGNGYVDDVHGWDFINHDGAPLDDNMHGTHVAGIAGAVGNNEVGIAGAAWNVKLMPVKILQSNGVGNATTIAQGIDYAANNGATVINMSFGSYAESMTLKAALENAYATSVLVASAGNDGTCIGPGPFCAPSYPAAYTFVLGVQDAAKYSNYDQDGPIYSSYSNLLNYELTAPGSGVLSTVPDGGYRSLTGTSMSAPLVAGGIALYLENKPEDSKELLFGNLINTSGSYVDFKAAIDVVPTPELKVLTAMTKDTLQGQNGNGYLEPGEIIDILPLVKNYWGPTDDVRVGIEFAEFEDTSKAEILTEEIAIGSISAYAELQDLSESLQIKLAEGLANNVDIKFNLKVWSGEEKEHLSSSEFVVNVKNSILLYGVLNYDLLLSPEREYLVSDNLIISENATVTVEPGTVILISDNKGITLTDNARIVASGTRDSLIHFKPENHEWKGFNFVSKNTNPSVLDFVTIQDIYNNSTYYNESIFSNVHNSASNLYAENLIIQNCYISSLFNLSSSSSISKSNIFNNNIYKIANASNNGVNLNIINNKLRSVSDNSGIVVYDFNPLKIKDLNVYNNHISYTINIPGTSELVEAYLGTSDSTKFRREVNDAITNSSLTGLINMNGISSNPYEDNHGIVWKVLVNGKDAQDEYDQMDPIGVGEHEFQVYFNREMDTTVPPQINYGVREPYTQKMISEEGSWSSDGKIYTVHHEVKIGAADGINRIRVQGARDLDYFEIPVEDFRFNMLVQSAGSASSGFFASPELGKIFLEWEEPAEELLEDVLGYNMYRYEALTETTFTEPEKLNDTPISEVSYADFNVEEGKKYFYQYKIMRTNFEESDFSKTVAASPLTSQLGDSNGDFNVNVLDLVQDVDHILGNNPQPFIFNAADVNADKTINVLDIVGTVDIINSPSTASFSVSAANPEPDYYSNATVGEATFFWEGNDLYVESEHAIAGLQFAFEEGFGYTINPELSGFEWLDYTQEEAEVIMMYSFNGTAISAGKTKLLTRHDAESSMDIEKAVVATPAGKRLQAIFSETELEEIYAPEQTESMQLRLWPNPSRGEINMNYYLPEQMDLLRASLYSFQGQLLWSDDSARNTAGGAQKQYQFGNLQPGMYLMVIEAIRGGEVKHQQVKKIIIE